MSIESLLDQPLNPWMQGKGPEGDIVLSSRVRLARNLDDVPFPNRASNEQLAGVVDRLRKSVNDLTIADEQKYMLIELEKLSPLERYVLVEKHLISPNHAQEPSNRALVVREDTAVSIMVNEEDHLRIQCLVSGLDLRSALEAANRVDDVLESKNSYAFSEQMGYLTACPTNLGTGLRASVMVHLPALVLTRQIHQIMNAATQLGLAVRGLYGEGSEATGNIFQISNQQTLGYTEEEIAANLEGVARQVVNQERAARQALMQDSKEVLDDRVWRSLGILRYARSITGEEALARLSEVRLGSDLRLISAVPASVFNELLVRTRPNFLQKMAGKSDLDPMERDRLRAEVIRHRLAANLKEGSENV